MRRAGLVAGSVGPLQVVQYHFRKGQMNSDENYVHFPVPSRFVPQVTTYVADLLRGESGHRTPTVLRPASTGPDAVDIPDATSSSSKFEGAVWTAGMFERLASDDKLLSQQRV